MSKEFVEPLLNQSHLTSFQLWGNRKGAAGKGTSWAILVPARTTPGGWGVQAMIFISPAESESVTPGNTNNPVIEVDDLSVSNAW